MNILMFTNTFLPHVGGVARSVTLVANALRERGHRVLIVAPSFEGGEEDSEGVLRFPAFQQVSGSDYSVPIPLSRRIGDEIDAFAPDIVHSHHPFLLGDTALRVAAQRGIPIVDTNHTRFDLYARNLTVAKERIGRAMWSLAVGYCNLCDAVVAPSESIREMLIERGVKRPVRVIPTGIVLEDFASGDRARARRLLGLPEGAFVAGHLGRLATEKNLDYLAEALIAFLKANSMAHVVIAGEGDLKPRIAARFQDEGLASRLHLTGIQMGSDLPDFYAALDVFAFASLSETQGIVLSEAMAAGCPLVALDAPGAREAVAEGETGFLLAEDASHADFAAALGRIAAMDAATYGAMREAALHRVKSFSVEVMADRMLALYRDVIAAHEPERERDEAEWSSAWRVVVAEGEILWNIVQALGEAVLPGGNET
ncbi:glycosyltransferase [Ostreiculturibacter nitratireducens]|uniref:glycosyltransferase n=1 Tax=Ostreiculturibacter nitratireducens TaxID=3075226 RepID=UPI0031B5EFD2